MNSKGAVAIGLRACNSMSYPGKVSASIARPELLLPAHAEAGMPTWYASGNFRDIYSSVTEHESKIHINEETLGETAPQRAGKEGM